MLILLLLSIIVVSAAENAGHGIGQRDISEMPDRELMKELMMEIQILKKDRDTDRERIRNLEKTVDAQKDLIVSLQQTVAEQAPRKVQEGAIKPGTAVQYQNTKKDMLSQSTHAKRQINEVSVRQPVAFSSYVKPSYLDHLGAHQNIVFDSTFVNFANSYNVQHGVFTVPVSGVYVITSTVLASNDREVWCAIVVNGNDKVHMYARGTDRRHDQGSQTILLDLSQGDEVSVQNEEADDAIWGHAYTTFSGFLLFEEQTLQVVG